MTEQDFWRQVLAAVIETRQTVHSQDEFSCERYAETFLSVARQIHPSLGMASVVVGIVPRPQLHPINSLSICLLNNRVLEFRVDVGWTGTLNRVGIYPNNGEARLWTVRRAYTPMIATTRPSDVHCRCRR